MPLHACPHHHGRNRAALRALTGPLVEPSADPRLRAVRRGMRSREFLVTAIATSVQTDENWLHPLSLEGPDAAAADEVSQAVARLVTLWSSALGKVAPQLSGYQFRALEAVHREPGVNVTGLAETLRVGAPACSRLCGRLETAGLLERRTHPGNRREVVLGVTPEGRRVVRAVTARRHHDLAASLARMAPGDREALVGGLRALHANDVGHPGDGGPGKAEADA